MASLTFQPFVDKENVPQGVQRKGLSGLHQRNGGKIFNNGLNQNGGPPRKALGDVNKDFQQIRKADLKQNHQMFQKPKGLQVKQTNIIGLQPQACKPVTVQKANEIDIRKRSGAIPKTTLKAPPQVKAEIYDEIEKGPVNTIEDDDFEDIWPKADRISTYLHQFIRWRPPCFKLHPDSDSELEEEIEENKREFKAALEQMPKPTLSFDAICDDDLLPLELVDQPVEEIPLPDEPILLDDSIDMLNNIGTLELKDS